LLSGCANEDEHRAKVREVTRRLKDRHGADGLREVLGLEYRLVPCEAHRAVVADSAVSRDRNSSSALSSQKRDEAEERSDDDGDDINFGVNGRGLPLTPSEEKELICISNRTQQQCLAENGSANDSAVSGIANAVNWTGPKGLTVHGLQPSAEAALTTTSLSSTSIRSSTSSDNGGGGQGTDSGSVDLSTDCVAAEEAAVMEKQQGRCNFCIQRLYHVESNTMIDADNRKLYIADGDMYDVVARLCQEYAFDCMCKEANLKWVTIDEDAAASERSDSTNDDEKKIMSQNPPQEPLRALINADHPLLLEGNGDADAPSPKSDRPTVIIATGRGKVRAGIFSRQNLMSTGLETATAVPVLRECVARNLNIIVVDPNVHGERLGFVTFEKTMNYVARQACSVSNNNANKRCSEQVILSHSASGGHLARYLLDKPDNYLDRIRAVAFTDSTHNIQWAKTKDKPALHDFLESSRCVYFRSSQVREQHETSECHQYRAGEPAKTDAFW